MSRAATVTATSGSVRRGGRDTLSGRDDRLMMRGRGAWTLGTLSRHQARAKQRTRNGDEWPIDAWLP